MKNLLDEQALIDVDIVNEAIASTSEDWKNFTLNLEYIWADDPDDLGEVKSSLVGENGDFETPSDELFESIQKLNILFHRFGVSWLGASYNIFLSDKNKWKYEAHFQY